MKKIIATLFICTSFIACKHENEESSSNTSTTTTAATTPEIGYSIKKTYPHDKTLFTEGLFFYNDALYESSGAPDDVPESKSVVGISDLNTGKFTKKVELDKTKYFGEGAIILNNKLYQLTYKNQQCFVYDATTFKQIAVHPYSNKEGWGLTTNGTELIMSDGSNLLTFLDPEKFIPSKTLQVTENDYAVFNLNELEYVDGFIYANVWMQNTIVKIDANSGKVVGKINLSALMQEVQAAGTHVDVLNGIAYNNTSKTFFVTGKLWPSIYEISLN